MRSRQVTGAFCAPVVPGALQHSARAACARSLTPRLSAGSPAESAPRDKARLLLSREEDAARAERDALPVEESPALTAPRDKYLFPMRADNTQVFFDHSASDKHTLMVVFANDHHGFVLDVVSVLKALGVKCWRIANSKDDALRLMIRRIEGELVSLRSLDLNVDNCYAFWITDEETSEKISDDPERLEQVTACIKLELSSPNPRPTPADDTKYHRVFVEHNRANRYTIFNVQTSDRPRLLAELSIAFAAGNLDVCSAAIQTADDRVENTFYVRNANGEPLPLAEIENGIEHVMRALLRVGEVSADETLWYQVRNGSAVSVAEALFINQVCNKSLATFAKYETPNFRGRLPDAPYRPVSLQ